jgi:hypothetical protein
MGSLLVLCLGQSAQAAGYCSLVVRVLSPERQRPLETPVSVLEATRTIEKETTGGDLEFCDLGLLPVTVVVGTDSCRQVVVKDIPLAWQEQQILTITYDRSPCLRDLPPPPVAVCQVMLRVSDQNKQWLRGAQVAFDNGRSNLVNTDEAGRAVIFTGAGAELRGVVTLGGFSKAQFTSVCTRSQPIVEIPLTLMPR